MKALHRRRFLAHMLTASLPSWPWRHPIVTAIRRSAPFLSHQSRLSRQIEQSLTNSLPKYIAVLQLTALPFLYHSSLHGCSKHCFSWVLLRLNSFADIDPQWCHHCDWGDRFLPNEAAMGFTNQSSVHCNKRKIVHFHLFTAKVLCLEAH